MKLITDYNQLKENQIYYINTKGYIINNKNNEEQPEFISKEIVCFIDMNNDISAKFIKLLKNDPNFQAPVIRILDLYDIYEPQNENIFENVINRKIFKHYLLENIIKDEYTSHMIAINLFKQI
jgi:hypothetical protein